ncbi:MAG: LysR family transcriptional regulator [Myxococcaceae bacterium]|nr:LysR family transcriptional regulator [Myxococcaceae bacterium]
MNWDDLRCLQAALETKSLVAAARRLGVKHTTIGRRLQALEDVLGAPLFLRGPDGLRATGLAERLRPLVEATSLSVETLVRAAAADQSQLRIAVPSGFTKVLAPVIAKLRRAEPGLTLNVLSGSAPVNLRRGEADVALRYSTLTDPDLVSRRLRETTFYLYAAKGYRGSDLIGFEAAMAATPAAKWLEARGGNVVLRAREIADKVAATVAGLGMAALPDIVADLEPGLVRVERAAIAKLTLSMTYRREQRVSRNVRAVTRALVETLS